MGKSKGVIISGGSIDKAFALRFLHGYLSGYGKEEGGVRPEVIAADRGLGFCLENGIVPDAVVGDFDSGDRRWVEELARTHPQIPVQTFQPEKDWTDTELAADLAVSRGWKEAVILGGTGGRIDHLLGNLAVLERTLKRGMDSCLLDADNRIRLTGSGLELKRQEQWGTYVSLVPWGGPVEGLTLTGFRYPLTNAHLPTGASLGISNEIAQETARIRFARGLLLVIESRDH